MPHATSIQSPSQPPARSSRDSRESYVDSYVAGRDADDGYVGRRRSGEILGVPGEAKILRALSAKHNATRRMGQNHHPRRSHGRGSNW